MTGDSTFMSRLLPIEEERLLRAYIAGTESMGELDPILDAMAVPVQLEVPRLAVAVAQILLHEIQETLPQWYGDGNPENYNRQPHRRHKDARLVFNPRLVVEINWANSGPGFSWPEAYHVTYVPGFDKHVVTASRDGEDAMGCSDHAIGFAEGSLDPVEAAKRAILPYWSWMFHEWEQRRWVEVYTEGLVDARTVDAWADELWEVEEEELNG